MLKMSNAKYVVFGVAFLFCLNAQGGIAIVTLAGLVLGNLGLLESMYEITFRSK